MLLMGGACFAALVVAAVAFGPWWSPAERDSALGSSARAAAGDMTGRILTRINDSGDSRGAAPTGTRATSPAELVAGLREAMRLGDERAAAQFVDRWFAEVADPARAVLAGIAGNPEHPDDVRAFGLLLASAMVHARHDSKAVQPWTAESIAAAALDLFPEGDGAARALRIGLEPSGSMLPGRLLGDLLELQADDGVGALSLSGQIECMSLADAWGRTMSHDAEVALLDVFARDESGPFAQGQAVKLLLRRDWRVFAETLLDVHLARQEEEADFESEMDVIFHLATHAEELTPAERIEYATLLFRDEGTAANLAVRLSPDEAAELLEQPGSGPPPAARRWLELISGNGAWMEAGIELMGGNTGHPSLSWGEALATLVERGASGDPAFENALQRRFEGRAQARESFWGAMRAASLKAADEATLRRTFVPLVEASVGEAGKGRSALVELLRERLLDPRLE